MAIGAAVQVVHAGDVLLVLVDAVLDVLLGFGHDAVVVPAELGRDGRLVGGGFLPELAHVGLFGGGCLDQGGGGTSATVPGGAAVFPMSTTCCSSSVLVVLHRGSWL